MISDLNHLWGGDLGSSPSGDIALSSGTQRGQQRVLRRLLTNPGDYVFQPSYGAGLPQYVGQLLDVGTVVALIRSQILLEDSVAKTPPPQINVRQTPTDLTGFAVTIGYTDALTKKATVLSFNVSQ